MLRHPDARRLTDPAQPDSVQPARSAQPAEGAQSTQSAQPAPSAQPETTQTPTRAPVQASARRGRVRAVAPGLLLCAAVGVVATLLGGLVPVVGAAVLALVLGVLVGVVLRRARGGAAAARVRRGVGVASKQVLQVSIVVLGTGLSMGEVARVGARSLPVMLGSLAVALLGAWVLGRALRVPGGTTALIGVGTGVCGASAIAAVTAVTGMAEAEVAYAVGTIFTFNVVAVLVFPIAGHLLGLSQSAFGLWAGTAVNDTSSVVAAGSAYGAAAGAYAVVVKLTRSLTIVPISLAAHLWHTRRTAGAGEARPAARGKLWRALPVFIIGFLVTSVADTVGLVPAGWHPVLSRISAYLVAVALAGIGLSLRPDELRRAGARPLLLGGLLWVLVAGSSLGLQFLVGWR